MCSVPGVPTPGSEVSVVVTRVNLNQNCGLVELWASLNNEIKHVYEQMREEIQIPTRNFCGPEGKNGDLCLVNVDEKWHRARIVSIQDQNYNVFLIDHGQPHATISAKLAWGRDECFILPPEIECCVLANVLSTETTWPERATNFLKSLPGKEFQGLVQNALMPDRTILLDLPIISKHLCKEGVAKKIPGGEFKNLVLKCLNLPKEKTNQTITKEQSLNVNNQLENENRYFYPELMTNTLESIRVTEVIDPGNLFCELAIYSKAIKILSEQLNEELKAKPRTDDPQPPTAGMPCAVFGIDGKWRRSILKQQITSKDAMVEVFFVDEGKTELVQATNVKKLDVKFLRMPVATYNCKLDGVKNEKQWEQKEINYLKSLILNQNIIARFDSHILPEDQYSVSLYTPSAACINDQFLEKKVDEIQIDARPRTMFLSDYTHDSADPSSLPTCYSSPFSPMEMPLCDLLTVGACISVKISCVDTPNKFWCQTSQCDKKLGILMSDLQAHYASVHPKPLVDSICVARNPDNNMWYRAKIIANQRSPDVEVRFIDFGQTKKVPLRELHPIDPTFLRLDAQAFQCSLFDVPLADINYANEEFHKFVDSDLAQNGGLTCVIKAVESDEEGMLLNVVDLKTQSESLSQVLAEKLAARPELLNHSDHKIKVNSKEKLYISYSETVHNFYGQLEKNSQLFQQLQNDIEKLVANYSFALDDLCIARYKDSKWQRGQVVETSPDLKVHFVDFGETRLVNKSDIRPFPREASAAKTIPVLAVPLGLFNIPEEIPQEINAWFVEKVDGQSFTMSVLGKGPNGKLMVELFDGLKSLNVQVRDKIVNFAKAEQEEKMDVSSGAVMKQNNQQKSPTTQSEQLNIKDKPTSPSQNAHCNSTAKETDASIQPTSAMENNNQGNTKSTPNQTATSSKSLTYKKPIIYFNKTEVLHASCISSPDYFWCQRSNTDELDKVTELAQNEGQAPQDPCFPQSLRVGSPCLALYRSDKQWYRAQVVEKHINKFSVVFIDYGNEEEIDYKNVRPISTNLLEISPQAFLCTLYGIVHDEELWLDSLYDEFYELLTNKPLNVKVLDMTQNMDVNVPQYMVHIDNADVDKLLNDYVIGPSIPPKEICELSQDYFTHFYCEPKSLVDKKVEAIVTSSSGPGRFWCQYSDSEKLIEITKLIPKGSLDEIKSFSDRVSPGSPCLVLSDNEWKRAQVIKRIVGSVEVALVDYGCEHELYCQDTRPIPLSLRMIQPQAFLCRMEHFDENALWNDKLNDQFHKAMADKVLELTIVSVAFDEDVKIPLYTVELGASSLEKVKKVFYKLSVPETTAQNSLTTTTTVPIVQNTFRSPKLEKNTTVAAYALTISGPGYFWCQFSDRVQLNKIEKMVKDKARMLKRDRNFGHTLVPGDACIGLSPEGSYYRAQILRKMENKFTALFIDYGREGDVMIGNARPISQSLLQIRPRAFLCCLNGFDYSKGSWDDAVFDYFNNFLTGKLLKVTPVRKLIHKDEKLSQFVVDIECGTESVKEVMQKYWKATNMDNVSTELDKNRQADSNPIKKMAYKNPKVTLNKTELVYASCIGDPHFFWCQFVTWADSDIKKMAQEAGLSQPPPTTLSKGDSCLALFSDDNHWYRALISEKKREKINVIFIDYGNESDNMTIKDTRILPQNLLDEPPQAFLCTLYGFDQSQGTWDDDVYDDFYNTILSQRLKVKIMSVTENADLEIPQYAVMIEMEGGTSVNKLMEKYWTRSTGPQKPMEQEAARTSNRPLL